MREHLMPKPPSNGSHVRSAPGAAFLEARKPCGCVSASIILHDTVPTKKWREDQEAAGCIVYTATHHDPTFLRVGGFPHRPKPVAKVDRQEW
jgi:hypothetical protein